MPSAFSLGQVNRKMVRHMTHFAMGPKGFLAIDGHSLAKGEAYRWKGSWEQFQKLNELHGGHLVAVDVRSSDRTELGDQGDPME